MALRRSQNPEPSIGDIIRRRRVEVLKKGLREMARELTIAPAHLTDIEKGRRTPSEGLLKRISAAYGIGEAELRAAWSKADEVVQEVATQDTMSAEKVPQFLRTARKLNAEQWDQLIRQAEQMAAGKTRKERR
ncbi:MAG TPA: helix-turn-helix transcriptional regulator [Phycisphaerae bacterium]|nr:helix-turn-helix transcriptional regulator [Phycisphaerae bacterium]HRY67872.1 helix-turn-helix transcriptional regulator [Phycisphaerae bacterium]HSA25326.1 helix-turn-helix transcriptional regulator [Phycisphaerae bacterium]